MGLRGNAGDAERAQRRQGRVPGASQRLHRSRELGALEEDRHVPRRDDPGRGTGECRREGSGKGYFQGEFIGLEATIKSKANFPAEPGNRAYFSFSTPDHKTLTASADRFPAASCNGCHQGAAADDWVFTQYYPVLRDGKKAGKDAVGGTTSMLKAGK